MLEEHGLLLGPWRERDGGCPIRGAGGVRLGLARRERGRPGWLGRLAPAVLAVYETEDEALLCSVRRGWWGRAWRVFDAEGRLVGTFRRGEILDWRGECVAQVRGGAEGEAGLIHDPAGLLLAVFEPDGGATALSFLPASEGEPFLRMALLGAVLTFVEIKAE